MSHMNKAATDMVETNINTPMATGKSLEVSDTIVSLPIPGKLKICSKMIELPINKGNCAPKVVIIGIKAFFKI